MNKAFDYKFYNGEYIKSNDIVLSLNDRAFRYGDGLFETMHANGQKIQFFNDHMQRFRKGIELLKLPLSDNYTNDYLNQCIEGVLHRCRLYQGASVKLSVWRAAEGKYIPKNSTVNILIEAIYLNEGKYELNKSGLIIDIYNEIYKPINPIYSIKSCNSLIYILAGNYAAENNLDDVILLNDKGYVVETTSSNIFLIKDKVIYTPSLKTGCLPGVMRKNIIQLSNTLGFKTKLLDAIKPDSLKNMDEIFITNANRGINWIVAFQEKRYLNRASRKLIDELNKVAFNSFQD